MEAHELLFPAMHKTTYIMRNRPATEIWEAIATGQCYDKTRPVGKAVTPTMLAMKDEVIPILEDLKKLYLRA